MNPNLQKILNQLSNLAFLSLNKTGFQYGILGRHFARNLENLWFQQCITKPSYNVFMTSVDKPGDALKYIKSTEVDFLPFGLGMLEQAKSKWNQWILDASGNPNMMHKIGKVIVFTDNDINNVFNVEQRERKMWWRKLACHPLTFAMTELTKSKNYDSYDIVAQFPFGNIVVETVKCYHDIRKLISPDLINEFGLSETKAVEHIASLDWGSMALLCDGYKESNEAVHLDLHPKISPYKLTFSAAKVDDDDSIQEDLNKLVLFLNNKLRVNGINSILTNNEQSNSKFQVPFIVNVDRTSLKDGMIQVNSQLDSETENVHMMELVEHISSRCL